MKLRLHDLPIKRKLLLITLITCGSVLALASTALFGFQSIYFRCNFISQLQSLGEITALNSAAPLMFGDVRSGSEVLSTLKVKRQITAALVTNRDGAVFVTYAGCDTNTIRRANAHSTGTFSQNGYVAFSQPIVFEGSNLGTLYVEARFGDTMHELLMMYGLVLAGILAFSLGLILALSSRLHAIISRPILELSEVARRVIEREDYQGRAREGGADEFGILTRSFNGMLDQIQVRDSRLRELNRSLGEEISERKRLNKELVEASRLAGMAEVASGVLHNVGNVLNSVNVSATLVTETIAKSKIANIGKLSALINEHAADLPKYLNEDPNGKRLPGYLQKLAVHLNDEHSILCKELEGLKKNVDHIKDVVAMQQSYARVSGVTEILPLVSIVEDAIAINMRAIRRQRIEITREFENLPATSVDKHKLLQILVNLIRNARQAMSETGPGTHRLSIRVGRSEGDYAAIEVTDSGVGISKENLTKIFRHGFTTKTDGHGFGLHSAAIAAREMGGSIAVRSPGPGLGATFIVNLPLQPASENSFN